MPVNHGLKESRLKPNTSGFSETAESYAQWFVLHKLGGAGIKDNLNNDLFVGGKNEVVYEETLTTIDQLGFFLMTVGADFVTDAIGCIYAAYHQEKGDAAIYTAGFVSVGLPGGALRQLLKNEYKIVKEGENTIKIVDRSGNVVHQTESVIEKDIITNIVEGNVSKTKELKAVFGENVANRLRKDVKLKIYKLSEEQQTLFFKDFINLTPEEAEILSKNPALIDVWSNSVKSLKTTDKIASVEMLECIQKHSNVSLNNVEKFISDDIKGDLHKFFKENKTEILQSEQKFKVLVGDLDEIPSYDVDELSKIKNLYSFVKNKKLSRELVSQAGKGFARRCPKEFAVGALCEATKQLLTYIVLRYEHKDLIFNWVDFTGDVIAAGFEGCKNLEPGLRSIIFDCITGGDLKNITDVLEMYFFESELDNAQKNTAVAKLKQFGTQCVINVVLGALPRAENDPLLRYTAYQLLDLWSKFLAGEIEFIIK